MKTKIEQVTATSQIENEAIIRMVSAKIEGLTRIEEAYAEVDNVVSKVLAFDCGRGANHIWVSNYKGERLMLITETRYHN
jgi:methyltransferase-like protein